MRREVAFAAVGLMVVSALSLGLPISSASQVDGEFPDRVFTITKDIGHKGGITYASTFRAPYDCVWWLELVETEGSSVAISVFERSVTPPHLIDSSELAQVGEESTRVSLLENIKYVVEFTYYGMMGGSAVLMEHAIEVGVNNAPEASFAVFPTSGDLDTVFAFDASGSSDVEDPTSALEVRWDWQFDGVWDTTWSTNKTATHQFHAAGDYCVALEVRDSGLLTDKAFRNLTVTPSGISRSVEYLWYDMFGHPIGEHYDWRASVYGDEWRVTDEYPYLYLWLGAPPGNMKIYTFSRLDITGRDMPELNMNSNPEFLPYLGTARGGTATIDWYMDYITEEEGLAKLGPGAMAYFDGWFVELMGTTTLDEQAAKAVLGVSDAGFDDFAAWWDANEVDVKSDWESWMINEASNDRLAIYNAYEYDLQFVYFAMDAEKVADEVVVTLDTISWGAEALMFRWLREAFMPTEWYMEDMYLQATIGPETTDIDLDAAVQYALHAYESIEDGSPCWAWEAMLQDYVESSLIFPYSEFDQYADFTYLNWAPGSDWYGYMMSYDHTPGAWNLSENETLTFQWPDDEVLFFKHDIDELGTGTFVENTIEFSAPMTVRYAEPDEYDAPGVVSVDDVARTITFEGPFDMWTWSKEQTEHEWLAEEWDRLEILPHGIPFVEFIPDTGGEPMLDIEVSGLEGPYEVGEEAAFTVTVVDYVTGDTYTGYAGTVTFSSSDGAAVLPADCTFVPADAGTHDFTVVFNTVDAETHEATHTLSVWDIDNTTVSGTASDILVTEAEMIDHFVVAFSGDDVIALEPTSVTVTAYNQWDEVYEAYEGIVNFTSNDGEATLPQDSQFTAEMNGAQKFNITFSTAGIHVLHVCDVALPEAKGSASTSVLEAAQADHFVLTGVRDPAPLDDQPETMTIVVCDQYNREFEAYSGTVLFTSNRQGDVVLPEPTPFSLGSSSIEVVVEFLAVGEFTIQCSDSIFPDIAGTLEVVVIASVYLDHFEVSGIQDMWENNHSDVTIVATDNTGDVFEGYVGTVTFSSSALWGATLPEDYTFVIADGGRHTFPLAVSFDDPGTYSVYVSDLDDPSITGTQEDILICDLIVDSLTIAAPSSAFNDEPFSVTVSALHQFGELFQEYDGTVHFTTSDISVDVVLPEDYAFTPYDGGSHTFLDGVILCTEGSQTITVHDTMDPALASDCLVLIRNGDIQIQYKVYDMFEEPYHEWWDRRFYNYGTDLFLTSDDGNVTMLNFPFGVPTGDPTDYDQTLIYAPYRWNITGEMLPNANVHEPEFMPILGTGPVTGAEASVHIYFNYLTAEWWNDYWVAEWSLHPDWSRISTQYAQDDGYIIGTHMKVSMNRLAAEEWIGLDRNEADVATWWLTNRASYEAGWEDFIVTEANDRLDIMCGFEDKYWFNGVIIELSEAGLDEVYMEIAHFSWGYEALMTRWLDETAISTHQPWFEDFEMVVDYGEDSIDIEMDAVCQWSMHCNKQNESGLATGAPCAWVWEPLKLDYVPSSAMPGEHPSEYDPYEFLTYQGWNCGDCRYGATDPFYYDRYECTPNSFSLPDYGTLVFELPDRDDVLGYYGEAVTSEASIYAWMWYAEIGGNIDEYIALQHRGSVELGWHNLGAADYLYDVGAKVLTINGPYDWYDWRDEGDGTLWHGAPWIEFNVVESAMAAAAPPVGDCDEIESQVQSSTSISTGSMAASGAAVPLTIAIATLVALTAVVARLWCQRLRPQISGRQ